MLDVIALDVKWRARKESNLGPSGSLHRILCQLSYGRVYFSNLRSLRCFFKMTFETGGMPIAMACPV